MYKADYRRVSLNPCRRFGLRVKELRAAAGVTQEELAERVGVFRTYMSRIETGEANPTLTVIHALADALGADVRRLFDELSPQTKEVRTRSRSGMSRGRVVK